MSKTTVVIPCGPINVTMPLEDLVEARPGYLVHPTEGRGPSKIPIVVRERDLEVLDPDDEGRFRVGRRLLTFEELAHDQDTEEE